MISLEAYRSCIGSFAFVPQRNIKSVTKHYVVGTTMSSNGVRRLLKPAPFLALFTFLLYAYPKTKLIEELKVNVFSFPLNHVFVLRNPYTLYPQKNLSSEAFLLYMKTNFTL